MSVLIRFSTCGYVNALRLFDIGLGQIGTTREAEVPREIGPERWRHWHYRLLVDQAWARFGIHAYAGSEQDLKDAVALETTTPAAYCLLLQVQVRRGELDSISARSGVAEMDFRRDDTSRSSAVSNEMR